MKEIWKDIEGYEGLYQVSNLGRVKSLKRETWGHNKYYKEERILVQNVRNYCNHSHYGVNLAKDGKYKTHRVHRLVAQAFIPNPQNKPEIDHIDTNPLNNRVDNLRWVTRKENMNNPLTLKHMSGSQKGEKSYWYGKCGKLHPNSKPVKQLTLNDELVKKWDSASQIQKILGFLQGHISSCCRGLQRTAYGFKWQYA